VGARLTWGGGHGKKKKRIDQGRCRAAGYIGPADSQSVFGGKLGGGITGELSGQARGRGPPGGGPFLARGAGFGLPGSGCVTPGGGLGPGLAGGTAGRFRGGSTRAFRARRSGVSAGQERGGTGTAPRSWGGRRHNAQATFAAVLLFTAWHFVPPDWGPRRPLILRGSGFSGPGLERLVFQGRAGARGPPGGGGAGGTGLNRRGVTPG